MDILRDARRVDVYMYDFLTEQETRITSETQYRYQLSIQQDKIVWFGYRDAAYRIFTYDLTTEEETERVSVPYPYSLSQQQSHKAHANGPP